MAISRPCKGHTLQDERCKNRTKNPNGICGASHRQGGSAEAQMSVAHHDMSSFDVIGHQQQVPLGPGSDVEFMDGRAMDLNNAHMAESRLYRCNFDGTPFRAANFTDVTSIQNVYDNADFTGGHLDRAHSASDSFVNAEMRGVSAEGFVADSSDFDGADLCGADLRGADLSRAHNLDPSKLELVTFDDRTQLPEGMELPPSASYEASVPFEISYSHDDKMADALSNIREAASLQQRVSVLTRRALAASGARQPMNDLPRHAQIEDRMRAHMAAASKTLQAS